MANTKNIVFDESTIGGRIRISVFCRGITQKDLAKKVLISEDSLVNYIKNRSVPSIKTITRISEECFVESDWVINKTLNFELLRFFCEPIERHETPIELIANQLEISDQFITQIQQKRIMPSLKLLDRLSLIIMNESERSHFLQSVQGIDRDPVVVKKGFVKKNNPVLKEIIFRLIGDHPSQKIVLDLLRSIQGRDKL